MKRINFILAILLIITSGNAQVNEKSERKFYKQGDWELGFSSNIGSINIQTMQPWFNGLTYGSYEYSKKGIYLTLGVYTGFYIINGLSIEPELNLNLTSEGFSVSMLGNLCYTFYLPQKYIYPYLKLGYGVSNDPDNNNGLFEYLEFKTINAGAGVKLMYFPGMAFKLEIIYRSLNGSNTIYANTPDSYTTETTTSIISGSLGISILL
jgi:hypothetical protein